MTKVVSHNGHSGKLDPANTLEDAPALSKALLPPHQGLLFMLLESLPHAVSGNTRDGRGCLKRYSKKEQKQSTVAVSTGRVILGKKQVSLGAAVL